MSPAFDQQKEGRWDSQHIENPRVFVHTMAFQVCRQPCFCMLSHLNSKTGVGKQNFTVLG